MTYQYAKTIRKKLHERELSRALKMRAWDVLRYEFFNGLFWVVMECREKRSRHVARLGYFVKIQSLTWDFHTFSAQTFP